MLFSKLLKECFILQPAAGGGFIHADKDFVQSLSQEHPKQFLETNISVTIYRLHYTYKTAKDKYRNGSVNFPSELENPYEIEIMAQSKLESVLSEKNATLIRIDSTEPLAMLSIPITRDLIPSNSTLI